MCKSQAIGTNTFSQQMIYYVKSLAESIKFHHELLKNNGRLMIIVEAGKQTWTDWFATPLKCTRFLLLLCLFSIL